MQIQNSPEVRDVLVIGSGAAGGMAAWNLTRKGIKVTMHDAGQKFNRSEFWTHVKHWEWQPGWTQANDPQDLCWTLKSSHTRRRWVRTLS